MRLSVTAACKTEKGRRPANEDACLVLSSQELRGHLDGLLIVADGMGGRASGAVASKIAIHAVRDSMLSAIDRGLTDISEALFRSLKAANAEVLRKASAKPDLQGMGTTCVAVAIVGGRATLAHMGDSRAYLLRNSQLIRLTEDHSIVAERVRKGELTEDQARKSRFRNVITRAVGLDEGADPEISSVELESGDMILACTDGLTIPVSEAEITDVLIDSAHLNDAARRLVTAAVKNGGSDNITVAVAAYGRQERRRARRESRIRARRELSILVLILVLIFGMAAGLLLRGTVFKGWGRQPVASVVKEADLAQAEYEDPTALLYSPIQGRFLALDQRGYLYVVDLRGQLIRVDTSGQVSYRFPTRDELRPAPGRSTPLAAVDGQGNLYVSNPKGGRIEKYGADGVFLRNIGEGKLVAPEAMQIDERGTIYVVDGGRLKVVRVRSVPTRHKSESSESENPSPKR